MKQQLWDLVFNGIVTRSELKEWTYRDYADCLSSLSVKADLEAFQSELAKQEQIQKMNKMKDNNNQGQN